MKYETFKRRWQRLSERQREKVRAKANWEHMGLWAVMNEWFRTMRPTAKRSK